MEIDRLASAARKERGSRAELEFATAETSRTDQFLAECNISDDDNLQLVHIDFEREMAMYTDVKLNFIISFLISRALEHQRAAALAKTNG